MRLDTKDVEMKFFIPHASDVAEAEQTLASIAKFVGAVVPEVGRRIWKLEFRHNGRSFSVEVGQPIPAYYEERDQPVIAIFAGEPYKICLPTRGVVRGDPILAGANAVTKVEFFEV